MFRRYEKVHRLGKEETDGILEGTVTVQEKLDGANASIWMASGEIHCGSRSRDLTLAGDGFNGFVEYVEGHEGIKRYLKDNPTHRLYGEWLVRHSLSYPETAYRKFYLFDVHTEDGFMVPADVERIALSYEIQKVHHFGEFTNPTYKELDEIAGKSQVGEVGEGIVIKNPEFVNSFGDRCNAKIVTEDFKESNGIIFGGNNKHSDTYWEMYVVNKYMTLARIEKIMHKVQAVEERRLSLEHTPRIINTAFRDMLVEEIWDIAKKVLVINFKTLKRIASKKAAQIYKDKLLDDLSIADQ